MTRPGTNWTAAGVMILATTLVFAVVWALWGVLLPFILGAILAYILDPLVIQISRLTRWSRTWAVSLLFVLLGLLGSLALLLIWPVMIREIGDLVTLIPTYVDQVQQQLETLKAKIIQLNADWGGSTDLLFVLKNRIEAAALVLSRFIAGQVMPFVTNVVNLILIPVITFFLLKDKEEFLQGVRSVLPPAQRPTWQKAQHRINVMLAAYFRGTAIVGLIIAVVSFIGFQIMGMPFALLLSVIRGIGILIPYVGFVFSIIPPLILAAMSPEPWTMVIGIAVLFAVTEFLQGFVLVPTIMGGAMDLHELTVLFAVFVGGATFGIWGIILALPAAAIIKILVTEALASRGS